MGGSSAFGQHYNLIEWQTLERVLVGQAATASK